MDTIKLILADDNKSMLQGLNMLFSFKSNYQIIDEASNGEELIKSACKLNADILLVDLNMPKVDGLTAIKRIRKRKPKQKVVVFTFHDEEYMITSAFRMGANAVVLKGTGMEDLFEAIDGVHNDGYYFNKETGNNILNFITNIPSYSQQSFKVSASKKNTNIINTREKEVLLLLCQELTTKEIADKLFLSTRTVENYRHRLMIKLEAKNMAGLVVKALKNKIITIDPKSID